MIATNLTNKRLQGSRWFLACALVVAAVGCQSKYGAEELPLDEAMRRLEYENRQSGQQKKPEKAAKEYFLPSDYVNYGGEGTPDYFEGMDRVALNPGWKSALDAPVYQLLTPDTPLPATDLVASPDPVSSQNEILGRNTWMMWCGGNEGFWDWLATDSLGFIDLLKVVDSRNRSSRFADAGMINEPDMMQSGGPDDFGLWLDTPIDSQRRQWRGAYLESVFDSIKRGEYPLQRGTDRYLESKSAEAEAQSSGQDYSGPAAGNATGGTYDAQDSDSDPPADIYGISSGVVGLRLFPNPNFDEAARERWDADRYYNDEDYWNDPKLVRPYRVGMSCAYCHASFHPLNPPGDVSQPQWENISGNIGAQYLRIRAVFGNLLKPDNFVYHILDSQPPGTIDTSLVASDSINNPNAMNAVFNLTQRVVLSFRNPQEHISSASASQPSVWDPEGGDSIPAAYVDLATREGILDVVQQSNGHPQRHVPRILLDGADSIGAWGALARVYLNIGTYWEQWQRLHRTVVGFSPQKPFTIVDCERGSLYWHATQDRVPALRDYFLKVSPPMPLLATEGAQKRLKDIDEDELRKKAKLQHAKFSELLSKERSHKVDLSQLKKGRKVFARNCIVCHSSIQPESSVTLFDDPQQRADSEAQFRELIDQRRAYRQNESATGEFWEHDPARWLGNADYRRWAECMVENEEFWRRNYLSTDYRVPITMVKTNAGRALGTNAIAGNMWDDFASDSYQSMPSVGAIDYFNPYKGDNGGADTFTPRHKVRRDDIPEGGGGVGFYRVPSLVSIWATAPFLHNNSLGTFNNDPSVNGRLEAFDDAMRKMLWPEKRLEHSDYASPQQLKRDHGLIWRTPQVTYLTISGRRVPALLSPEVAAVMQISDRYPWLGEVRPKWLPSAIVLLASFMMLLLHSARHRRIFGGVSVGIAAITALLAWIFAGSYWAGWISPPIFFVLLWLGVGLLFLLIDYQNGLRWLAGVALLLAGVMVIVYLLPGSMWIREVASQAVPLGKLAVYFALLTVLWLLLGLSKQWRYRLGTVLLVAVAVLLVVAVVATRAGGSYMAESMSFPWTYLVLGVAAAVVLLTPDRKELHRYLGYSLLVLGLAAGGLIYFFAGQLGDIRLGPIPKGTPVNLLANLNPDADPVELAKALKVTLGTLAEISSKHLDDETAQELLRTRVAPALMTVSKCPDFVMDRGHYFPWFDQMSDEDKEALIELLKTF